jgi:hypothetical protein
VKRARKERRGVLTVAALVCLLVVMLIAAGVLRLVRSERGLLENEERRLQADWLVESGLERALARLGTEPAYRGETWSLPAEDLGGAAAAVVTVTVEPGPRAGERLLRVQADYPRDAALRVRAHRDVVVGVPAPPTGAAP